MKLSNKVIKYLTQQSNPGPQTHTDNDSGKAAIPQAALLCSVVIPVLVLHIEYDREEK